jgi:hypothetical protein
MSIRFGTVGADVVILTYLLKKKKLKFIVCYPMTHLNLKVNCFIQRSEEFSLLTFLIRLI